ncbi:MAG TPA: hypothetical protein VKN74_07095 [Candidatus Mcinerneyibacterium sp.]|nr:hypothetical protein [Candidatus Mcinerneyibacterium sp.]
MNKFKKGIFVFFIIIFISSCSLKTKAVNKNINIKSLNDNKIQIEIIPKKKIIKNLNLTEKILVLNLKITNLTDKNVEIGYHNVYLKIQNEIFAPLPPKSVLGLKKKDVNYMDKKSIDTNEINGGLIFYNYAALKKVKRNNKFYFILKYDDSEIYFRVKKRNYNIAF